MHPWITVKSVLLSADMKIEKHVCLKGFLQVSRHHAVRWRRQDPQEKQNNVLICRTLEVDVGCVCRGSLCLP